MIVRTFQGLQALTAPQSTWSSSSSSSLSLYGLNQAYGEIYRTQPNVRICVDFLARNTAQLGLPVYRRISDTDRERLADHDLARWLSNPNPATTRYRLIESLVGDLAVYFNAYWLKVRYERTDGRPALGLVRLPPEEMAVEGGLLPTQFVWTSAATGKRQPFPISEIVYFNGYNATNALMGLSPLETLRRILAEEAAAGEHREAFWRNASKQEGVWELAANAPGWKTPEQQNDWRDQWQKFARSAKAGMTAVGPIGGTYKPTAFSAKDSEYVQGGKLRREICAAQWHIPQPMVGILEHATFSNIREQHKHLYQDCLGPTDEMITQEIERQVLVECEDQESIYVEFNIDAKLAGSFEEQAAALQVAVGKPFMKVNEARAVRNLPRDDDPASDRIAPQQGGPSDATARPIPPDAGRRTPTPDDQTDDDDETARLVAPILHAARLRQQAKLARLSALERAAAFYDRIGRWNQELTADLTPILGADVAAARAREANKATLDQLLALEAA